MTPDANPVTVRLASEDDLPAINAIIEACVMGWDLPERVKRLSLDSYRYHAQDLDHLAVYVATSATGEVVGVAALEQADEKDLPANRTGLLLHGIYVMPGWQRSGVGKQLLARAFEAACEQGVDGLLVKAQADANSYFASQGFNPLPVVDPGRDYPHRWWRAVTPAC